MKPTSCNPQSSSGCGCHCAMSRRRFLSTCAAGAAGAAALAAWPTTSPAADAARKVKVRLVFSHPTSETITWPNVGFDYDRRGKQLTEALTNLCPAIEFLPVHAVTGEDAQKVIAADAEVDGYLVCVLGLKGMAQPIQNAACEKGRPMIVVDDPYGGWLAMGFNAKAAKAGWKAVALHTSRVEDLAAVARTFAVLGQSGATADTFLAAARVAYKKIIAPQGDLACAADAVGPCDVGKCVERLRTSAMIVVGKPMGNFSAAIQQEFGVRVVPIDHKDLHEAFLKADPAQAVAWADRWTKAAEKTIEPSREDLVKSGAMHVGMEALLKQHHAQAITVNCLGGFYTGALQAFPCLGFTELSNGPLVGACEADVASTVTMMAVGSLIGRPGFISDPVMDLSKNRIIYAHCVAPTKVFGPSGAACPFHLRNHSEDRKGAAVRSLMPLGYMTTSVKFLPGAKTLLMHQAKTVENVDEDKACRTKLAAEVKGDIEKLFSGWTNGWHRVTFYGDVRAPIEDLCKALNIKVVQEA